jgi:hypothetical protein
MNSQSKIRSSRYLAIGGLAFLFILELTALEFHMDWLWDTARMSFAWSGVAHRLENCSLEIRILKSQHFALLVMFIPLKAILVGVYFPARVRVPTELNLLNQVWSGFAFVLLSLVGLVPSYILLFLFPGSSPYVGRFRYLYALCQEPTLAYAGGMFFVGLVAAGCMLPLVTVVATLARSARGAPAEQVNRH